MAELAANGFLQPIRTDARANADALLPKQAACCVCFPTLLRANRRAIPALRA